MKIRIWTILSIAGGILSIVANTGEALEGSEKVAKTIGKVIHK